MEPRHVNEGEDNMSKSDMNTAGYVSQETVEPCEAPTEHAYSENSVKELLTSIDDNLATISKWMKSVNDRISILEKRERFKENLNNHLDLHDDEDKSKLIEASRCIEGYFDLLADDGFPIIPWSDEIVCIPANTKHYDYDPEELDEFKENGEYTNYACLVKIKTIMQNNGIVWGSIANGAPDELTWFNLTCIKDSFTINDTVRAVDCIYKIGDRINEPLYVQTYHYDPEFHEFFNGEKKDMGGIKDITITATSITKIEDNPVALVKIRCRDDEDFTGTWIKYSDLRKMN